MFVVENVKHRNVEERNPNTDLSLSLFLPAFPHVKVDVNEFLIYTQVHFLLNETLERAFSSFDAH